MALIEITPKQAGIYTNGTEYSASGRWVDGNFIRFQNGALTSIGGWEKAKQTALLGTPIAMYSYNTNNGKPVIAIATRQKIYVNFDNQWVDITPVGYVNDMDSGLLGWGAYNYNVETYNTARSQSGLNFNTKSVFFDNWGEYLIFCASQDGKIYQWQPSSPTSAATQITNSPTGNTAIIVSNERHLVALGSNSNPRRVAFSNREDYNTWTPAATNTAGSFEIPSAGTILGAKRFNSEIVIFTDVGVNRMSFVGSPFIYGSQVAGENCPTISIRSVVSTGNFLCWLGENSIYMYDGQVREVPCDVSDFIHDNLNRTYAKTACGGHNSKFSEVWWFFPSGSSTTPDKYILWDYSENTWSVGSLDRSCWMDSGTNEFPMAGKSDGSIFVHEKGQLQSSDGIDHLTLPFARTAPIEINGGNTTAQFNQIIPDEEAINLPALTLSFKGKNTPNGPETDFGSFNFDASDGYTDARFSGRQITMTVTGVTTEKWKVGKIRADIRAKGKR